MFNRAMQQLIASTGMPSRKRILLLGYMLLAVLYVQAQWNIYSYVEQRKNQQDLLSKLTGTSIQKGYVFFGNSESHLDNVQKTGYTLPLVSTPTNASFNKYVGASYWQSAINQTVVADEIDPLYIGLTVFAENIKEYLLALHEKGGEWRYKKIECKRNRYQLPQELAVTPKFFEVVGGPTFRWQLDSIAFLVIPHHAQKTPQLVLGELTAYQKIFSQRPAKAHFFHEFTSNPQNRLDSYTHRQFGNQYPLAQVTSFADFGPNEYRLEYPNITTDTASLQKQTLSFIAYTIKKYPFFTEHRLNKAAIWAKADSILQAPGDFRDKLKAYQQLTAQLNDAHFYFETAVPKSGVYPLMAKNINGRITVAGVIDPDLSATVEPGMEIVSLAGVPVKRYIDSLAAYFAGDTRLRNELAVSRLFGSANGNPLTVTLNNNGNEPVTVTLSYNKKLTLPPNFRSEHFRYQLHHDRTGYLRLTRWNHGDWINFFSLGEELAKLENIIFDLRGNGGGQELDMMQIASCFFKRPTALLFNTYQYLQKGQPELSGESILIPNPHLHLQHLTIRILADARTGCASEMFIKLLQRSGANIKVVAAENTTGSYAHLAQFILPFNIVLHTNVMAHSYLNKNRETIEYRGIHPDINVSIASYKDLAPYEDKLLQTALSDLTSSKNEYSKK